MKRGKPKVSRMRARTVQRKATDPTASSGYDTRNLHERIAARAHELYRERGVRQGDALSDWLEAEQQVLGQDNPGGAS